VSKRILLLEAASESEPIPKQNIILAFDLLIILLSNLKKEEN